MRVFNQRGTLHLQLGQETIYLIMSISVFAAVYMAAVLLHQHHPQKDPPIILMKEADGYYFPTGSSAISDAFSNKLTGEVLPRVRAIGDQYDARVIEVIGHTDEVPLKQSRRPISNLDISLLPLLNGVPAKAPIASDNVGLGMARAVAVARILHAAPSMNRYQIIPMSAGPFERTDDTASLGGAPMPDPARRRIEIRVRRRADR